MELPGRKDLKALLALQELMELPGHREQMGLLGHRE